MANFDKFTERARKVLQLAQEEAQRFNHNYIGTEHLLLGLVREGDGVAARVLANMNVQLPKVRSAVEFIIGRGNTTVIGEIGLTPRAKKVLELAVDEGRRLNHHYIGTEHLLLGMVREGEGIAAGVLESLGVNLDRVRDGVRDFMSGAAIAQSQRVELGPTPTISQFSVQTLLMLGRSASEANTKRHQQIGVAHVLLALYDDEDPSIARVFGEVRKQLPDLRESITRYLSSRPLKTDFQPGVGSLLLLVLRRALRIALQSPSEEIEPIHILNSVTDSGPKLGTYFLRQDPDALPETFADAQLLVDLESELTQIQQLLNERRL